MEYGLIGKKLTHSFSRVIHEYLESYNYELIEISEDDFTDFIGNKNYKGLNVTIPYKEKIIPYLDFIDDSANKIGAVNTVVNKDGKLYGFNTDFDGLKALMKSNGFAVKNKKVLIFAY